METNARWNEHYASPIKTVGRGRDGARRDKIRHSKQNWKGCAVGEVHVGKGDGGGDKLANY